MTSTAWTTEDIVRALDAGLGIEDVRVRTGLGYQTIADRLPEGEAFDTYASIAIRYALQRKKIRRVA